MEERIITLTKVFRDLNLLSHDSLFEFDGDEVIPRSDRVKLLFHHKLLERRGNFSLSCLLSNALEDPLDVSKQELVENMKGTLEEFPKSFVFLHNPTCYDGDYYKYSSDNTLVKYSKNFGQDTRILTCGNSCTQRQSGHLGGAIVQTGGGPTWGRYL